MNSARTVVHFSGDDISFLEDIKARDCRIACDWTSEKHKERRAWPEQYNALTSAIKVADVVFLSFEGSEETSYFVFAQFYIAMSQNKQIIVHDPNRNVRDNKDDDGNAVPPSFDHIMGKALTSSPNVLWIADREEALDAIHPHAKYSIHAGSGVALLA